MRHPHDSTSLHTPQHRIEECFFIAIAAFLRGLNALREQPVPSQGGQRGARWGTPGNGVGNAVAHDGEGCGEQGGAASGSRVGNPGEWGGERGGTRWGGLWGARWSSLGEPGGEPWGAGWGAQCEGSRRPWDAWSNPREPGGENGGGTPSGSHDATEQGISGGSDGTSQPVFATITCDKSKWGAPVSRRTPLSTAICVRRQSSSLRLSQRRS